MTLNKETKLEILNKMRKSVQDDLNYPLGLGRQVRRGLCYHLEIVDRRVSLMDLGFKKETSIPCYFYTPLPYEVGGTELRLEKIDNLINSI